LNVDLEMKLEAFKNYASCSGFYMPMINLLGTLYKTFFQTAKE